MASAKVCDVCGKVVRIEGALSLPLGWLRAALTFERVVPRGQTHTWWPREFELCGFPCLTVAAQRMSAGRHPLNGDEAQS